VGSVAGCLARIERFPWFRGVPRASLNWFKDGWSV
jgi:hypothetical protein